MIAAMTADGYIAKSPNQISTQWTSRVDGEWFAQRTKQAGVCVMGRTTFQTMGRALPERTLIIQTSQSEFVSDNGVQVKKFDEMANWHLQKGATEVLTTNLPISQLADKLVKSGVQELAICGGASIYTQWLKSGLVNKLYLTIEPKLFGQGVSLLSSAVDVKLNLVTTKKLNSNTLLMEYTVSSEG